MSQLGCSDFHNSPTSSPGSPSPPSYLWLNLLHSGKHRLAGVLRAPWQGALHPQQVGTHLRGEDQLRRHRAQAAQHLAPHRKVQAWGAHRGVCGGREEGGGGGGGDQGGQDLPTGERALGRFGLLVEEKKQWPAPPTERLQVKNSKSCSRKNNLNIASAEKTISKLLQHKKTISKLLQHKNTISTLLQKSRGQPRGGQTWAGERLRRSLKVWEDSVEYVKDLVLGLYLDHFSEDRRDWAGLSPECFGDKRRCQVKRDEKQEALSNHSDILVMLNFFVNLCDGRKIRKAMSAVTKWWHWQCNGKRPSFWQTMVSRWPVTTAWDCLSFCPSSVSSLLHLSHCSSPSSHHRSQGTNLEKHAN